jgi:hypothetical protein
LVEEHFQRYVSEGWKINSVSGFGGGDGVSVRGWIVVLLEKTEG